MVMEETNEFLGRRVKINYVGRVSGGEVFDDHREGEPYEVMLGTPEVFEPMAELLATMGSGEEASVRIPCEQAYGEHDPKRVVPIPRCQIRGGSELRQGMSILWRSREHPEGTAARVVNCDDDFVDLDFNHPLSGKDLEYWFKVVEVMD